MHVAFGWIYETSTAMARLVLSGILERYQNLKLITHHGGGMIPFLEKRITGSIERAQMLEEDRFSEYLKMPLIDYFKMLYCDTALYGSTSALMCSYAFFGADNLLFGTDMPYGGQLGETFTRDTIESVERMDISHVEKDKIFEGNARKLLCLPR
jgi:predicted TIM-barrel fold metal-dependent hydrolase